jgi:hypothetical protein
MTTNNYRERAKHNLRAMLAADLRLLYRTAFNRCGRGLTEAMFDEIVQELHTEGFLTVGMSRKGMRRLELLGWVSPKN